MSFHRLRLAAAAVLTSLVTATTAVTVTAPPAHAVTCDINDPGDICYSAYQLVLELGDRLREVVDEVGDNVVQAVQECLRSEPGSPCDRSELVQEVVRIAGVVLVILLDAVANGRALADQAIATVLLLVNDQVTQLKAIADEVAGPYIAMVEELVGDLTTLIGGLNPSRYSVKSSSHAGTGYRVEITRACTATSDRPNIGASSNQTITVVGAATAITTPTSGVTATRFTKLQCVLLRDTPTGPVELGMFERQLANPFSAVTGSKSVTPGDFYVCARGEVTLTNNAVVAFADC